MADQSAGASIADAYRNWTPDAAAPASDGAAIADAYRTTAATTPPQEQPQPAFDDYGRPIPTMSLSGISLPTRDQIINLLQPDPNMIYGSPIDPSLPMGGNPAGALFSPFARDPKTGLTHFTLPPAIRSTLLGLAEGVGPNALTYDSQSGTLNLTPEAQAAASLGARPLAFGGALKPQFGPPTAAPQFGPPAPPASPAFVPPGTSASPLPRILELLHADDQVAANRPAMIPPNTTTDPVTGQVTPVQQPPNPLQPQAPPSPATAAPQPTPAAPGGAATPEPAPSPTTTPAGKLIPIVTQAQAEAEADRIIRHFAGNQPVTISSAPLPSGAQPTLSQSVQGGNAGLAALERGVRDVPEQTQYFSARETANTNLRNQAVGEVIGDPRETDVTEAALNAKTKPQKDAILSPANTTPVQPSNTITAIDSILAGPEGQRDVVADSLNHIRDKLVDKDGNLQTDPTQLSGIDSAIGDMIGPKAAGTAHDGRQAAYELMNIRGVLRSEIEQGAPGYNDYMASQAAARSAIDGQRFLQARNITDRMGNVNLGTLDSTIKAAERQQSLPGARLADGVTDEQLNRLKELRADYQNDAKQRLGVSIGSPTVQKFGVSGSMAAMGHPLLAGGLGTGGAWLAGINPLIGTTLAGASYLLKQQSAKGQAMVMDALRDKLLNPEKARGALSRPP